jgi:hypothetical protein
MLKIQSQLSAISEVLEVSANSNSEQEKNIGIKACIQLLTELKNSGSDDNRLYYLLGYAWYLSPESEERSKCIVSFLSTALEQNFENEMAKVYLCHHFFDQGMYTEFLKHYQQIERVRLARWRKLKFSEMNIIAKIATDVLDEHEVSWYIKSYEAAEEIDQPVIREIFAYSKLHPDVLPASLKPFIEKWSRFWNLK